LAFSNEYTYEYAVRRPYVHCMSLTCRTFNVEVQTVGRELSRDSFLTRSDYTFYSLFNEAGWTGNRSHSSVSLLASTVVYESYACRQKGSEDEGVRNR